MNARFIVAAAIAAALAPYTLSPGAHAQSADVPTAVVHYGDLNLNSAAGRRALDRRIADAAYIVCSAQDAGGQLYPRTLANECVRKAMTGARTTLAARSTPLLASK